MSLFEGLNLSDNIKSFQSKVTGAVKDVKSNTLTSIDPTLTKVKEGVSLVTNKDTGMISKVNAYKSEVVNKLEGVVGSLSGGRLNAKELTSTLKLGKNGLYLDKNQLTSKIMDAYGVRVPNLEGFAREISSGINSEFNRLTGLNGNLLTTDGIKIRMVGDWRDKLGDMALKEVIDLTGMDGYLDASITGAFNNTVFRNAVRYGMNTQYGDIYKAYPPGMEGIRRDIVLELIDDVLRTGDLISLKSLVDLLEREGKNVIFSRYPDFVERLFKGFRFDPDLHIEDRPMLLELLKELLNNLVGKDWYLINTAHGKAYNLILVSDVSSDMRELLITWDEVAPLVCCSGKFKEQPAVEIMFSQFKHTPKFLF